LFVFRFKLLFILQIELTMNFSLLVLASPYSQQGGLSALKFAQTCLKDGHEVSRVFFYHEGIQNGSFLQTPQQDELNLHKQWVDLAKEHQLDLVICIAAALKRGLLNEDEAKRYEKRQYNLQAPFEISGLGQLLDAQINSDQLITFG
jgi:tRNA 2-thiouridine synthesizing protein D